MLIALGRVSVVGLALLAAGCAGSGTSRISDELASTATLEKDKKAVALIKLGAADPQCSVLMAGIGVRENETFRLVHTARIVQKSEEPTVAEVALEPGEYHVVSYTCLRPKGGVAKLAEPIGIGSNQFKKSYASFELQSGEIVNVGFLRLVPIAATQGAFSRILHVGVVATDWPIAELDRFKQQRPGLYAQMTTRLMIVPKIAPLTAEGVKAKCAEMKKLQAEGKLQNLPAVCSAPAGGQPKAPSIAKKEVRA